MSFPPPIFFSLSFCHWILLCLFVALTSLHFFFVCFWSNYCTQLAFMFTPDHFRSCSCYLSLSLAPKWARFIYLYLICCHTVSYRYHLVFYTHEKTFTAECFNGFRFFEEVNHRGTKRKIAKYKTMMMLSTTIHSLTHTHTHISAGRQTHIYIRVGQCGQCFRIDENDGLNLKSMFLALLNDVRLLEKCYIFVEKF